MVVRVPLLMHNRETPTDDEKSCMLLVMRVLSIVPLNFKVRVARIRRFGSLSFSWRWLRFADCDPLLTFVIVLSAPSDCARPFGYV